MSGQLGLGRIFNYIESASGVHIPLKNAEAVTFVGADPGVGATILTVLQSIGGASETALAVIDLAHKGPDVGGQWTTVTQTAGNTFDLADDTTNDVFMVTVRADELGDGYDSVEGTVDTGSLHAIIHDLNVSRDPANLASSV